ncbi:MAG: glycosyl hydrolase, partial [Pedobacter sp.]
NSPRPDMDEAWRKIALGSEHTWCFENPSEPYFQDAIFKAKQSYFEQAASSVNDIFDDSFAPITDKSNGGIGPLEGPSAGGIVVLNTNSWEHDGLITLDKSESIRGDKVVDESGADVPAQRLSSGELVFMASRIPAMGSRHYRVVKGKSDLHQGCSVKENILENGKLRVVIDKTSGNITQLVELATGYNYAGKDPKMGLNSFHWLPGNRDAPVGDSVITIKTKEAGPVLVEVEISSRGKGVRSVTRKVRLVRGQQWVGLDNVVDKLPLLEKDGIHFGFNFNLPDARTRIDIPWGIMEVEKDQWPQANRNWFALQRWADITNDTKGVTWCSPDAPLLQYGKMTANNAYGWGNGGNWIEKLVPSSTIYS